MQLVKTVGHKLHPTTKGIPMKKILTLLKTAREALDVAKKNLERIKDEDLAKLAGISEELGQVREEYQKVEADIRKKQRSYFNVLTGCVANLGSPNVHEYKMSDESSCQIYYNGEEASIHRNGGGYTADKLPPKVFVELSGAVIARILQLAESFPIEVVAEKTRLVEELKAKIQELIEDEKLKVPQP